jgi:hypothetical protein
MPARDRVLDLNGVRTPYRTEGTHPNALSVGQGNGAIAIDRSGARSMGTAFGFEGAQRNC